MATHCKAGINLQVIPLDPGKGTRGAHRLIFLQIGIIWLFLVMMTISLVFDIADVARYVADEREGLALAQ